MKTTVTTRHFELNESLKERAEERLHRLSRFFDRILDARVVVSFEKNRYTAEASVTANGTPIASHAVADTDRAALEQVLDKLEAQLRRHKDRLTRKKRRTGGDGDFPLPEAEEPEEEDVGEGAPAAAFDERDWDGLVNEAAAEFSGVMSPAEAAATLKSSTRESLGFTNPADRRRMVVFKRRDGRVGVMDVHGD
jgi:ribosome hibernation promoting factor